MLGRGYRGGPDPVISSYKTLIQRPTAAEGGGDRRDTVECVVVGGSGGGEVEGDEGGKEEVER